MMNLFDEILQYHESNLPLTEKYKRLYDLLDRMCKELTEDYKTDFSNLFSRLYAICKHTGFRRNAIEHFRQHTRRIIRNEETPEESRYPYDLKALCEAVSHFYHTPIPDKLNAALPHEWRALSNNPSTQSKAKHIRLVTDHWDETYLYGYSEQDASDKLLRVDYACASNLPEILYQGAQLNLLSVVSHEDVLTPELIILEPDYLIDISSLAECLQNYGDHPLNYIVSKFRPRETSHYILLGNAANQFLDDCVNEQPQQPATFERSIQKVFRNEMLAYSCCDKIDREYFKQAESQFKYIRETVQAVFNSPTCQIDKDGALLEPSFVCEHMGLQGRMDFLQGDFRNLIELKSGKAEGIGMNVRPKQSHALQMALYKEVLYYSMDIPRDAVNCYLFYSQYPKMFAERSHKAQIQHAMNLRNHIIANEQSLKKDGGRQLMSTLNPDLLNTHGIKGKLWEIYQRPSLEGFIAPIHQMDTLLSDYFYTFTAFVAREQFLSKTGDTRPGSNQGFAATWNLDTDTKIAAGNLLKDLSIHEFLENEGIEKVVLDIPSYANDFLPNFRQGDIIMLYERNDEFDNATNHQVIRGSIEELTTTSITITLKNKQRNPIVFNSDSKYAIEHDYMDSSYTGLYRGLYTLLTTPKHRRELLLSQRQPQSDPTRKLNGTYLNDTINNIVLQTKQAKDYFLLIGPPGTGKTSVALRSMVEEFHSDKETNILLLSYTNRAVDEICEMLENISTDIEYIRIGGELSCSKPYQPRLLKNVMQTCKNRADVVARLNGIRIYTGTVSSIMGHPELFELKHFDVAIIDEASQILEPQIIGILCAHKGNLCAIDKFILIGDHKQLPAVVLQPIQDSIVNNPILHEIGLTDCRNSLFERLLSNQQSTHSHAMLHRQGRMHPTISDFVNVHFYDNKLDIVPVPHQLSPLEWNIYDETDTLQHQVATQRFTFINTPYPPIEDSNKVNRNEAVRAAQIVNTIHTLCVQNQLPFNASKRIGIIVPFRNQISMIAHELAKLGIPETSDITIDTVERYQGSQRDIIIFSTTISQPYQLQILSVPTRLTNGEIIDRKLNVAITRAKKQLFIIGNAHLLSQNPIYQKLIEYS